MGKEAKKLISSSSIIFIGTIIGSFFSYLFNMLVGRWLGPEQYGEFAALLSLMMIISVFGGAVLTVTMKYSSELFAQQRYAALKKLFLVFSRYALFAGLGLFGISLLFVGLISNFLSIQNNAAIILVLFSFIFGFLMVVNRGILQGTQRFVPLSIISVIEPGLRLFFGIILIKAGFALLGTLLGIVLATVVVYLLTFFPLKKLFAGRKKDKTTFVFNKRDIFSYSAPAFLATVLLMISLNMDVLLIKHYFSGEDAGVYAAISTIGKIILYTSGPIISVMFPMISEKATKGDKHYKIFLGSLVFTLICGLVILGVYYLAPGMVINILYGAKYADSYRLLAPVGFAFLLYSLVNLITSYFLSIKDFKFLYFFFGVIVLQFLTINSFHSSIEVVVKILIATLGLLFVLLFGYYLITKREQFSLYIRGEYGQES